MARLLLDENLPVLLARELPGHSVRTVRQMNWNGIKNGRLLRLAEAEFDAFLTMDRSIPFQQSVAGLDIAVLIIRAPNNRPSELTRLGPAMRAAIEQIVPGRVISVGDWPLTRPGGGSPSA